MKSTTNFMSIEQFHWIISIRPIANYFKLIIFNVDSDIFHLMETTSYPSSKVTICKCKEIVGVFEFSWTKTTKELTFVLQYLWHVRFFNVSWFLIVGTFCTKLSVVFCFFDAICLVLNVRNSW